MKTRTEKKKNRTRVEDTGQAEQELTATIDSPLA